MVRAALRSAVAGGAPWPLVLYGPAGVGKTCAALCLLDHAGGEYLTASGLAELVTQAQQGRLTWYAAGRGGVTWPEELWRRLAGEPLVVLDELGSRGRVTDHAYDCAKRLLDERLGLPLVAVSNLGLAELAQLYDDRIASRLAAGTVVRVGGPDRRLQR